VSVSSRVEGFYRRSVAERRAWVVSSGLLDEAAVAHLEAGGLIADDVADRMTENVIGLHALPLSVALNFVINGRDVVVPMAVEEPSVVAAASNAAKMVRASGGFRGEADPAVMTAQVELHGVPDAAASAARLESARHELIAAADAAIPRMVERGGGCRGADVRVVSADEGLVVVHFHVDVGDAMGANLCDTVAEAVGPLVHELGGGELGLRILTNLPLRRMVRVEAFASDEALGGAAVADGVARASRFAELDPFRAVTHNKGLMNGLDAVAVALGQDWRAIEAGAHAYASLSGQYGPLATWKREPGGLRGRLAMPLAVGSVGGCRSSHPGVRAAFLLARPDSAADLAVLLASAGLASNLAALRALSTEGIQKGHMRLHGRRLHQAPELVEAQRASTKGDHHG
jgi:hydroxymethylglutaryl-CoA reductase